MTGFTHRAWAALFTLWYSFGTVSVLGVTIPSLKKGAMCRHNWANSYQGIQPQVYDNPYSISINQTKYILGQPIKVTLTGTDPFLGFVIQAKRFNQASTNGHFRSSGTSGLELSQCYGINDTSSGWLQNPTNTLSFIWVAPETDVGTLYFVATVFKDRSNFWTNVTSHSFRKGFAPIDDSSCGKTKGCYRYVDSGSDFCTPSTCIYMVTFQQNRSEATFEFTTSADWAAIGFSSDRDMGGDDVLMCHRTNTGAQVSLFYTHFTRLLPNKDSGLAYSNPEVEITNGRLSCRVTRPLKVEDESENTVDLNNDWYQLYAWGSMGYGTLPLRHSLDSPPTSEYKLTLRSSYNVISASSSYHKRNYHYLPFLLTCFFSRR